MASKLSTQVRNYKQKVAKAAGDENEDIDPEDLSAHLNVDISDLDTLATGDLPSYLSKIFNSAGLATIAVIGAQYGEDVVNVVNTRALAYARERAAELVGRKWVNGVLVDNPNAKWAITQTTRDMLNDVIYDALDNGAGVEGLADLITAMPDSEGVQAFSYGRAKMISRSETLTAHAKGDVEGLFQARATGLNVQKEWFADAEACPICIENQDAGPIDLDDTFPSGDDEPTAHPNCECVVNGYLPDEEKAAHPALLKTFNEDQPRDEHGRWTSGGGGGGGGNASDLYARYTDHSVTTDQVIDSVPGAREALGTAQTRLASGVETNKLVSEGGFKNPDGTYTAEREAVHQEIINGYLNQANVDAATPPDGQKPTMTILGGRGGSGKSFLTGPDGPVPGNGVNNDTHMVGNALYLNSDDIKGMLPGYQGWNAPLLHEEASDVFNQIDSQARELGMNVVHDSTMKTAATSMERLALYDQSGYDLQGHYMFAPPQQAAAQALGRFMRGTDKLSESDRQAGLTGRLVSPGYVLGSRTNESTFDSAKGMFSSWSIYSAGAIGAGKPTLYAKGGK